jgi:hypothetical protein
MTMDATAEKDGPQLSSLPLMVTNPMAVGLLLPTAGTGEEISASSPRITSATTHFTSCASPSAPRLP